LEPHLVILSSSEGLLWAVAVLAGCRPVPFCQFLNALFSLAVFWWYRAWPARGDDILPVDICPQPELWAPSLPPPSAGVKGLERLQHTMPARVIDGPRSLDTHYKCTPIQTEYAKRWLGPEMPVRYNKMRRQTRSAGKVQQDAAPKPEVLAKHNKMRRQNPKCWQSTTRCGAKTRTEQKDAPCTYWNARPAINKTEKTVWAESCSCPQ